MSEKCKQVVLEDVLEDHSILRKIKDTISLCSKNAKIVFITGAGISVNAGIPVKYVLIVIGLSIQRRTLRPTSREIQ